MGLTPQEIVGAPSGSSGQGTTAQFGNMFDAGPLMQQKQMEYDATQKALDRQNALDIAEIQYGTGSPADRTADAATVKVGLEKDKLLFDQMHTNRDFKRALEVHKREQTTKSADFLIYMAMLNMSPKNLRTSYIANRLRKQGKDILDPNGKLLPEDEATKILQDMGKEDSTFYPETLGILGAVPIIGDAIGDGASKFWQGLKDSVQIKNIDPGKGALGNKEKYTPSIRWDH